jgi:hypothetical protein
MASMLPRLPMVSCFPTVGDAHRMTQADLSARDGLELWQPSSLGAVNQASSITSSARRGLAGAFDFHAATSFGHLISASEERGWDRAMRLRPEATNAAMKVAGFFVFEGASNAGRSISHGRVLR